jgi:hypothetical protein
MDMRARPKAGSKMRETKTRRPRALGLKLDRATGKVEKWVRGQSGPPPWLEALARVRRTPWQLRRRRLKLEALAGKSSRDIRKARNCDSPPDGDGERNKKR